MHNYDPSWRNVVSRLMITVENLIYFMFNFYMNYETL